MISNELLKKRIAIVLYEYFIRECLEQYHCLNLEMDESLYTCVLKKTQTVIKNYNNSTAARETIAKLATDFYAEQYKQYDEPQDLKVVVRTKFAEFVVSGKLKEACSKGIKLGSQKIIKEINVDMINRIYTLIVQGKIK